MASASSPSSSTPKLVIPEEKPPKATSNSSTGAAGAPATTIIHSPSGTSTTATRKLTKILSTQSSFDRHHPPHPVAKRFSIDADPSSIILNTPVTDLSNDPSQQPSTPDIDEAPSTFSSSSSSTAGASTAPNFKDPSPARSPSLKKSDSFLEIPYEKGEIVDLIRLADDPNAAAHVTSDGQEVLLEHGAAPHDTIASQKTTSRQARNAFISDRLLPGIYFVFITSCALLGGFGYTIGRTRKRETTPRLTRQTNATQIFDDGQQLAVRALRRATFYSLAGVFSLSAFVWFASGRPKSLNEFRMWTGSWLPSIKGKKKKEDEGRTEFENLTELMQYLVDEDNAWKSKKKENKDPSAETEN